MKPVSSTFDEARLVHHADPVGVTKNFNRVFQQTIPGRVRTPLRLVQQPLGGIRDAVTNRFGYLPAVLAWYHRHQPSQVLGGLRTRLLAAKEVRETGAELQEISAPFIQFIGCHQTSGGLASLPLSAKRLTV
jgi:hypothetical protein